MNIAHKKKTSKVVALKKLDKRAKMPATVVALCLGIVCTLMLGVGMCLALEVLGAGSTVLYAVGIVVGVLGIVGVSIDCPVYQKILAKGKEKYASDILQLAKEISEEE